MNRLSLDIRTFTAWQHKEFLRVFLLLLTCSLALTYMYYKTIEAPNILPRLELHRQIIAGTAPSPYLYRVLIPGAAEITMRILAGLGELNAFRFAYLLIDFTSFILSLSFLYMFLRLWFNLETALLGSLLTAALMPVHFQYHYFQPWSLLEIAFFGLGLYTLYRQKWLAFGCVIFFSSLNRETAVFIPALYWLTFVENSIHDNRLIKDARVYFRGMIFILIWLGIFLGLRLWLGSAPHVVDPKETILLNLTAPNLIKTLIAGVLFLGPFWLFILPGFIHAPRFIRTTFFVIPFYLVPYLIWGYWYETRVLMALYPLLIATGLFAIFKPANGNLSDREGIPDE